MTARTRSRSLSDRDMIRELRFCGAPVRIELTTARLQGGSAPIRGYPRAFVSAPNALCDQAKLIRAFLQAAAGVVSVFAATCDIIVTLSEPMPKTARPRPTP